ncbi:hypothetical protein [Halococcus sediminicola]|uniref:hypothetical protein n=1 Tax=Halococcus sediminicola TaxID=1264579 RepID=UPI0012AB7C9E|nr:hypothetical protein [Halococcus sediminicola]
MTEYTILSYSESAGANMTTEGRAEGDTPKDAVMNYLNNQTDRTVQVTEGQGMSGYTAVPKNHWNTFTTQGAE